MEDNKEIKLNQNDILLNTFSMLASIESKLLGITKHILKEYSDEEKEEYRKRLKEAYDEAMNDMLTSHNKIIK